MKHLFAVLGAFLICVGLVTYAVSETAQVVFYSEKAVMNFVENVSVVINIAEVSKVVINISETPVESASVIISFVGVLTTSEGGKCIIFLPEVKTETELEDVKVIIELLEKDYHIQ